MRTSNFFQENKILRKENDNFKKNEVELYAKKII